MPEERSDVEGKATAETGDSGVAGLDGGYRQRDGFGGPYFRIVAETVAIGLIVIISTLWQGPPNTASEWSLVVSSGRAVAVPLYVQLRREIRQKAASLSAETLAVEADAKLRLIVGDTITPIAEMVGRIHQSASDAECRFLRDRLKQLVVEALVQLTGGEGIRAIFFELRGEAMRPEAWSGRSDPPNTVFTNRADDRRGRGALQLVRSHDYVIVDDLQTAAPYDGFRRFSGPGYRSFISVAVFSGEKELGMLTVDATEPFAFDVSDRETMRAMAQLLGAGLVERKGAP
jgi:hypothetical protein